MESLGIATDEIQQYTRTMAEILALIHWVANIHGNDIEFVLAPPRHDMPAPSSPMRSNILGEHAMWVLDFDLCRKMTMDLKGVEQAVVAFWGNDPYYPRPQTEPFLCAALFESSEGEMRRVLSQKFIEEVEKEGERRREQRKGLKAMPTHEC
ncbi:hypothetical protein N7493_004469 [Penicillium malachiteum]|uniref:DUF3669 domain-containing protein n=1 Tax=Penicillium malachiteum TaxID=1324776 RepID=A0AAD6HNL2_9EURO|nr:hypothetical protein N7493_004469 [Penicillium malachiteum]